MEQCKFDEIHAKIMEPLLKELRDDEYNVRRKCLSVKRDYEKKIYKQYERLRKDLKSKDMCEESQYIDRHKIASCLLGAIVLVSPVTVKTTLQDIPERMIFANEGLGFYTAICVLESFCKEEIHILIPEVEESGQYDMPMYVRNICIDLFKLKIEHKYNVLTYSNILFLLEELSKGRSNIS